MQSDRWKKFGQGKIEAEKHGCGDQWGIPGGRLAWGLKNSDIYFSWCYFLQCGHLKAFLFSRFHWKSDTNTQTWVGGFLEVIEVLPRTVGDNIEKPFSVWGGQTISKMKSSDESRNPVSD